MPRSIGCDARIQFGTAETCCEWPWATAIGYDRSSTCLCCTRGRAARTRKKRIVLPHVFLVDDVLYVADFAHTERHGEYYVLISDARILSWRDAKQLGPVVCARGCAVGKACGTPRYAHTSILTRCYGVVQLRGTAVVGCALHALTSFENTSKCNQCR